MSEWTDDDGRPLGEWVVIELDEWRGIVRDAGGLEALTVFSTLTDPDGTYGPPQIYTAWGRRDDATPLVDIREDRIGQERVVRKFVRSCASCGLTLPEPGLIACSNDGCPNSDALARKGA